MKKLTPEQAQIDDVRLMRSDEAAKEILLKQLNQIEANLEGAKRGEDIECLHDLRVSIRRSRSLLNRLKGVFPPTIESRFSDELAWAGTITTPVRDLDVYIQSYPLYRDSLGKHLHADLAPLYDFLLLNRATALETQLKELQSARFTTFLSRWRAYLERPVAQRPTAPLALLSIGEEANQRIWKTYSKVIKEGGLITAKSPPSVLHDLRKTCKKLRYLLEFFTNLYPEKDVLALIRVLKGLQENLGDFQDLDVQATTIMRYSHEMMQAGEDRPEVFMAMGVLAESFKTLNVIVRKEFSGRFKAFASKDIEQSFRKLTGQEILKVKNKKKKKKK
jgi:CHAD domain-containing protein